MMAVLLGAGAGLVVAIIGKHIGLSLTEKVLASAALGMLLAATAMLARDR